MNLRKLFGYEPIRNQPFETSMAVVFSNHNNNWTSHNPFSVNIGNTISEHALKRMIYTKKLGK